MMLVSVDTDRPIHDERVQRRAALKQATLRRVNEGMRGADGSDLVTFRCECGRLGCNQLIQLHLAEYESVRADPRRFIVVPEHELAGVEVAIERHDRYAIAEARAPAAVRVAEQTSPRHALDDERP